MNTYKRLWRGWMRRYRGAVLLALLGIVISAAASAGYAKIIQLIIAAFEVKSVSVIWWGPLLVLALTTSKGMGTWLYQWSSGGALARAEADLQGDMYAKLVHADLDRLQTEAPAGLASRFTADIQLVRMSVAQIFQGVSSVLILVFTVFAMLTIDAITTATLVALFALAVLPVNRLGTRAHLLSRDTQKQVAQLTGDVAEALDGIRMARTYQLESHLQSGARGVFGRLRELKLGLISAESRIAPMMETFSGLAIAGLLVIVGWRLNAGATSLANFMALMTGFGVISQPARHLGKTFALARQGEAALERIFALLDLEQLIADRPNAQRIDRAKGGLAFRDVGFRYPGGQVALDKLNLTIKPGQKVAFVGRSGAGKSTVFNLLPRLFDVSEGAILLDGLDLRDHTLASLRQNIAMVSQDSVLLSGTIAANIGFGKQGATQQEIITAAKAAAADGFISRLPDGYETVVGPGASAFSGGERQRLSIARAILRDAPILLLDEPTSALDAESEAAIKAALDGLSKGRTTLVIAHRLATILDADCIVVMDRGRVVETGKHAELLADGGLYAELYRLQFAAGA
ncbi:MAG: ABC transporter ATP-binding protein [Paracoccaceae bacterium]